MGPVDGRRQAAAGDAGDRRHPGGGAEARPDHPLALHLYIHAVEASPNPEKADAAADRLRDLAPGLGHLVHMPSHIDIRRGRWQEAIEANERAIAADAQVPAGGARAGVLPVLHGPQPPHARVRRDDAGREQASRSTAVRAMLAGDPRGVAGEGRNAAIVDGFYAMPLEVLVRFGRWEDVLEEPSRPNVPDRPGAAARCPGRRYAAPGRAEARAEQKAFRAAVEKVPKEATFGNNTAADLFAVADDLLEGEILVAEGRSPTAGGAPGGGEGGTLRYSEPPDWVVPVRHALGATLLKAGRPAEAEAVYREDLRTLAGQRVVAVRAGRQPGGPGQGGGGGRRPEQFDAAWKRADVKLSSSCFCQPGDK